MGIALLSGGGPGVTEVAPLPGGFEPLDAQGFPENSPREVQSRSPEAHREL